MQPPDRRSQQDFLRAGWWLTVLEPEPPLSFPRCWAHCQPCEVRGALPGADAGHGRSTDGSVCPLRSCAAWSLQRGISVIQILQALQARDNTARPPRSESNFFLLTSHHLKLQRSLAGHCPASIYLTVPLRLRVKHQPIIGPLCAPGQRDQI